MSATIDRLIRENVRLRDLLGRFVSLIQDDIQSYEGLALTQVQHFRGLFR